MAKPYVRTMPNLEGYTLRLDDLKSSLRINPLASNRHLRIASGVNSAFGKNCSITISAAKAALKRLIVIYPGKNSSP